MSDSEDYDSICGGPITLTEEECAEIDALSGLYCPPTPSDTDLSSNPTVSEEGMPPSISPASLNGLKTLSPFKRFRPNGRLSVTDLVAPTWCEVQFEYGLQQQRSRKLEHRPSKFMTRHGKQIAVEKETAIVNDATLKAGNAIHSALEREIHPDRIVIEARTQEEVWARKLCDMLVCIQTLGLSNICREFPVVGFVRGQLVAGIIDEIKRFPCSNTDLDQNNLDTSSSSSSSSSSPRIPKRPRGRPKKTPDNQCPDKEISTATDSSSVHHHPKGHCLFLSDSKTRFTFSLPSHSATLASRLQLMLYRNLLNDLISVSTPFDFDRLWQTLGVNSSRAFSNTFLAQIQPLVGENSTIMCLKDLERWWKTALTGLDLLEKREDVPVHEQLTIVYRLRSSAVPTSKRKKPRRSSSPQSEQLQRAIWESLQSCKVIATDSIPRGPSVERQTLNGQDASPVVVEEVAEEVAEKIVEAAKLVESNATKRAADNEDVNDSTEQPDLAAGGIIGQVQFNHDESLLNSHIDNVLDWWYGKREPLGVSIEDANRCNACEYISGCEWREKMAKELLSK